jgi:hypothetical protein
MSKTIRSITDRSKVRFRKANMVAAPSCSGTTELNKLGLPVICIDARHAKAAL